MVAVLGKIYRALFWLPAALGPVFTKELRVASRQRRSYVLRLVYLVMLTIFVVVTWLALVRPDEARSAAYRVARLPEVGKRIVSWVMCFQCIAAQIVAIVLTSTSISEEVRGGTLGVLAATPLTSFQIVAGKLFGRLIQLLMLLGISLPLLAVVRVFGGVPWGYVVAGLCVTLTASILAGAVALLFSMNFRRVYLTILVSTVAIVAGYSVLCIILAMTGIGMVLLPYVTPLGMLGVLTLDLLWPGRVPGWMLLWPVHCLMVLGGALVVMWIGGKVLRKVALRQATGEADLRPAPLAVPPVLPALPGQDGPVRRPVGDDAAAAPSSPPAPATRAPPPVVQLPIRPSLPTRAEVRRVKGSPLLWKERLQPVLGGKGAVIGYVMICLMLVLLNFALLWVTGRGAAAGWGDAAGRVQAFFVVLYLLAGMVFVAVLSALTIAREKESRCWPVLMTVPLGEYQLLWAKVLGVLRRTVPVWVPLGLHAIGLVLWGALRPLAILHLAAVTAGTVAFLVGLCVYFSTRLRRTTTAVLAALGTATLLWLVVPAVGGMLAGAAANWARDALAVYLSTNPVVQAVVVVVGGAVRPEQTAAGGPSYSWPMGWLGSGATTALTLAYALGYGAAGAVMAWRAARRFRRDVF